MGACCSKEATAKNGDHRREPEGASKDGVELQQQQQQSQQQTQSQTVTTDAISGNNSSSSPGNGPQPPSQPAAQQSHPGRSSSAAGAAPVASPDAAGQPQQPLQAHQAVSDSASQQQQQQSQQQSQQQPQPQQQQQPQPQPGHDGGDPPTPKKSADSPQGPADLGEGPSGTPRKPPQSHPQPHHQTLPTYSSGEPHRHHASMGGPADLLPFLQHPLLITPLSLADYDGHALDDLSDLDDGFSVGGGAGCGGAAGEFKDDHQAGGGGVLDEHQPRDAGASSSAAVGGPAGAEQGAPRPPLDPNRPRHQPSRTVLVTPASGVASGLPPAHPGDSAGASPASSKQQPPHHNNSLSSLSMFSERSDDDLDFLDAEDDPPAVQVMVNSGQFSSFALRMQELDNVRLQVRTHGTRLQAPENLRLLKELAQVLQASRIRCTNAHRKGHLEAEAWARLEEHIQEITRELEEFLGPDPKLRGVLRKNLTSGIRAGTLPAGRDLKRPALPQTLDDEPLAHAFANASPVKQPPAQVQVQGQAPAQP